jgi:hypothetical protein
MEDTGNLVPFVDHQYADAEEKDDLHTAEEEIHFGKLTQQVPAGQYQQEDIQGNEKEAPEIQGVGILAAEMAKGMGQQQGSGEAMEPDAVAFEALEGRGDDGKGDGIHKRSF